MSQIWGTVEKTQRIAPNMVRVVMGGPGLDGFRASPFTDAYVNALFLPEQSPFEVPFDADDARGAPAEHRPRGRRFTVRSFDEQERRLTIDFVAHGDVGHAGRWAQAAAPGDRLQMTGPTGGYRPDPAADWFLMAGDESALPAIAASLEAVPEGRACVALVVVDSDADELDLACPGELELMWLHRSSAAAPTELLIDAVTALDWRPGEVDVFVHGEAAEVRAVRRHLLAERGITKEGSSISPYWRRGHDDEAWRQVKADWIAAQDSDV